MPSLTFSLLDKIIAPPPPTSRTSFLTGWRYAHRGLHGNGLVENTRAAFAAAIAADMGIECDVSLSADGIPFVFHDDTLERLTGQSGPLEARNAADLEELTILGTDETIPRLDEVIDLVAGQVPILIELKTRDLRVGRLCLAVRRMLEGYRGSAAVMSFNPEVGYWFAEHAPRITRGLVISEADKSGVWALIERHWSLWRAKPDLLAYDVRDLPSRFAAAQRARGIPLLTWTVRGAAAEATAAAYADAPICETQA